MTARAYIAGKTLIDLEENSPARAMVEFKSSDDLSHILDVLVKERIYAGPVRDDKTNELVGIISILDVLDAVIDVWKMKPNKKHSLLDLIYTAIERCLETGGKAMDRAKGDSLAVVVDEAPLDAVCELMTEDHIHRLFVLTDSGSVSRVVTQSDIVNFFDKHVDALGDLPDKTIAELDLPIHDIVHSNDSDPLMSCFETMVAKNLRALPILSDHRIIGVISSTDFHLLARTRDGVDVREMTCLQFLQHKHAKDFKSKVPAITCHSATKLREVIGRFHASRVHRIYVVDSDSGSVSGVVTLGSVLRAVLKA